MLGAQRILVFKIPVAARDCGTQVLRLGRVALGLFDLIGRRLGAGVRGVDAGDLNADGRGRRRLPVGGEGRRSGEDERGSEGGRRKLDIHVITVLSARDVRPEPAASVLLNQLRHRAMS